MAENPPQAEEILRLRGLTIKDLPSHPEMTENQTKPIQVQAFVERALDESLALVDKVVPESFKEHGKKSSPPSAAKVESLAGRYPAGAEEWFFRRSVHQDEDAAGTATFSQFDDGLRKNHSMHEKEYTPNVFDANQIMEWDCTSLDHPRYREISMSVWEMFHHIPFPFENRVFNTLVISAKYGDQAFLVVQIPVDKSTLPSSVLERSHQDLSSNKYRSPDPNGGWKQSFAITQGMYVSVERVMRGPGSNQSPNPQGIKVSDKEILWEMGTASTAGGKIPGLMQKMAIPGQIAKDVGLFLGWVEGNRKSKKLSG